MLRDQSTPDRPEVVRHEERLRVGTTAVPYERLVLRKRITSEVRQVEVTVRREVLEVQRETLSGQATGTTGQVQEPLVIVLSEEVPVVQLQTRPYEQVRVAVDTTTEQLQVSETVRKEQVEFTNEFMDGTPA